MPEGDVDYGVTTVIRQSDLLNGVVVMTPDEIRTAINFEAEARLGISGDEFIRRWLSRELPDTAATSEIGILVRLLDLIPEDSGPPPSDDSR